MSKIIELQLKINDADYTAKITNSEALIEGLKKRIESVPDKMANWGSMVTGFNQGLELAQKIYDSFSNAIMSGAELDVLRQTFKGTADDIELFRKATAGTVSEANLIKLSNQANDLGVSLKDQALLFSLAEDAGDKYGGSVEENFQSVIYASEGNARGLKQIGIQLQEFNKTTEEMAKAQGGTLASLDAETQKRIRLDAIIKLSGVTLNDVKNKTKDEKDTLESLGVRIDEAKEKFGSLIAQALKPLLDEFEKSGEASQTVIQGVVGLTSFIVPMIPVIMQLITAKAMWATQSVATAGAVDTLTASTATANLTWKSFLATIGIGVTAGLAAGKLIDFIRDKHEEALQDQTAFNKQIEENSKGFNPNIHYVPGEGTFQLTGNTNTAIQVTKQTVQQVEDEIDKLKKSMKGMIAGSQEWVNANTKVASLQKSITYNPQNNDDFVKQRDKYILDMQQKNDAASSSEIQKEKIKNMTLEQLEKEKVDNIIAQEEAFNKLKSANTSNIDELKKNQQIADQNVKITEDEIDKRKADYQKFLDDKKKVLDEIQKQNSIETFSEQEKTKNIGQLMFDYVAQKTNLKNIEQQLITTTDKKEYDSLQNQKAITQEKINIIQQEIDYKKQLNDDYYNNVKYLDDDYLTYQLNQIEQTKQAYLDAGMSNVNAKLYETEAIKQLEDDYYTWKWEQYQKDNQLFSAGLNSMWAGYDAFWKEVSNGAKFGKEGWNTIWQSIKESFINTLADMAKEYLIHEIERLVIGTASMKAAQLLVSSTAGPIAGAWAPAATLASIATFGAAAGIGEGAVIAALGITQGLTAASSATSSGESGSELNYAGSFGDGGVVHGKLHKDGGIQAELEDEEYVINRKSSRKYRSLIEAINDDDNNGITKAITKIYTNPAISNIKYEAGGIAGDMKYTTPVTTHFMDEKLAATAKAALPLLDRAINIKQTVNMQSGSSHEDFMMLAKEIRNQTERLAAVERIITMDPYKFNEEYQNFLNRQGKVS